MMLGGGSPKKLIIIRLLRIIPNPFWGVVLRGCVLS